MVQIPITKNTLYCLFCYARIDGELVYYLQQHLKHEHDIYYPFARSWATLPQKYELNYLMIMGSAGRVSEFYDSKPISDKYEHLYP